jgi:hypothetical protein
MEQKYIPQGSGGEMSAKRLAVLIVPVLVLVSSALAQVNEVSITAGRTFVSTQTIVNSSAPDPHIHFGDEVSVAFNYGRLLKSVKIFGIYAEVPVAIYPRMDVHSFQGLTPKDIGALFVTPSVRVNFFSGESVTPWVSVGGGYGRFREAPVTLYELRNPGPTGTNTGVV